MLTIVTSFPFTDKPISPFFNFKALDPKISFRHPLSVLELGISSTAISLKSLLVAIIFWATPEISEQWVRRTFNSSIKVWLDLSSLEVLLLSIIGAVLGSTFSTISRIFFPIQFFCESLGKNLSLLISPKLSFLHVYYLLHVYLGL